MCTYFQIMAEANPNEKTDENVTNDKDNPVEDQLNPQNKQATKDQSENNDQNTSDNKKHDEATKTAPLSATDNEIKNKGAIPKTAPQNTDKNDTKTTNNADRAISSCSATEEIESKKLQSSIINKIKTITERKMKKLNLYKPEFKHELTFCNAKVLKNISTYIQKQFSEIYSAAPTPITDRGTQELNLNNKELLLKILTDLNNPDIIDTFQHIPDDQQNILIDYLIKDLDTLRDFIDQFLDLHDQLNTGNNPYQATKRKLDPQRGQSRNNNQNNNTNLPWNNIIQDKEDDEAEMALIERQEYENTIINYMLLQQIIPQTVAPDWDLESAIKWINNQLINFNIELNSESETIEKDIKILLQDKSIKSLLTIAASIQIPDSMGSHAIMNSQLKSQNSIILLDSSPRRYHPYKSQTTSFSKNFDPVNQIQSTYSNKIENLDLEEEFRRLELNKRTKVNNDCKSSDINKSSPAINKPIRRRLSFEEKFDQELEFNSSGIRRAPRKPLQQLFPPKRSDSFKDEGFNETYDSDHYKTPKSVLINRKFNYDNNEPKEIDHQRMTYRASIPTPSGKFNLHSEEKKIEVEDLKGGNYILSRPKLGDNLDPRFSRRNLSRNTEQLDSNNPPQYNTKTVSQKTISRQILNKIRKQTAELEQLKDSTQHSRRIIRKLQGFHNFSYQELQEISKRLSEFTRDSKQHRKMQVEFDKEMVEFEDELAQSDSQLYEEFIDASDDAKEAAKDLTNLISLLEEKITEDKVSTTLVSSHDRTQLQYYTFSGGHAYSEMNIYEVLVNHENIFKILSTSETMKGTVLKSHLKGHAKNCISEDLIDYGQIKEILIKNFGNKSIIISNLLKEHIRVGVTPPKSGNNVDWSAISTACQEHLGIIRRANNIIKLDKGKTNIINERYVQDIAAFLSQEDRIKIIHTISADPLKAYDEVVEAFKNSLELSIDMRRITLTEKAKYKHAPTTDKSKMGTNVRNKKPTNINYDFEDEQALAVNLKEDSIKDRPDCKICIKLREIGRGGKFFEKHLFNRAGVSWNSYCPLYLSMNIQEKNDFISSNNICRFCLEPKLQGHSSEECRNNNINKGQGRMAFFKCSVPSCPERFELCNNHSNKNQAKINSMKERYQQTAEVILTSFISTDITPMHEQAFISKTPKKMGDPTINDITKRIDSNDNYNENTIRHIDINKNYNDEKAIFLFHQLKGRTRGINTVYDSAASALITTHNIPVNELFAIRRPNGGITVQGLGSSMNDVKSWDIQLPLANGKHYCYKGFSVKEIVKTLNLPNLEDAHESIKNEFNKNDEVKASKIYKKLNGEIEILVGIRLNKFFPEKVVCMQNGLTLYKLQLTSHHEDINYCLGGPYHNVSGVLKNYPESSFFFQEVTQGISEFEQGNHPRIPAEIQLIENTECETILVSQIDSCDQIFNELSDQDAITAADTILIENDDDIECNHICKCINKDKNDEELCLISIQSTLFENDEDLKDLQNMPPQPSQNKKNKTKKKANNPNNLLRELNFVFDTPDIGYRCPECQRCTSCKIKLSQEKTTIKGQYEDHLINKAINLDADKKCFVAKLPLTEAAEDKIVSNKEEARVRCIKELRKLQQTPKDISKIKSEFEKLLDNNYATKFDDLPERLQQKINDQKTCYFIPWSVVTKVTSVTTAKRIVYDASAKTKSKYSLNDICAKGSPNLDFDPMVMNFCSQKYGIITDLKKFYHSVHLHEDHYHLQMIWWSKSMDPNDEPEIYVITRLTFGVSSSSQLLERAMELVAEDNKNKKDLYRFITTTRYVDDCMSSFETKEEVQQLKDDIQKILPQYGMVAKGFAVSYEAPDSSIADGETLFTGGYIWNPIKDTIQIRIQPLHYAEKRKGQIMTENVFCRGTIEELDKFVPQDLTLRQVLSRASQIYDPLGLLTAWKAGLKTLTRQSMQEAEIEWDKALSPTLRKKWIEKFHEYQRVSKLEFKRNNIPLGESCTNPELICFVDAGRLCKVEVVYILHQVAKEKWVPQLIYSKSQIVNPDKTIPVLELEALHMGATILNKCYNALPNITKISLVGDSTAASYWVAKDTISLATFQRNRVLDIRRLIDLNDIYTTPSKQNPADIGTKEIEPVDSILPGSMFNRGPDFLEKGTKRAIKEKILTPVTEIIKEAHKDTSNETWNFISDGLVGKCKWPIELLKKEELPALLVNEWVNKVVERYEYSNYIIDPLKKSWSSVIRSLSIVYYYIYKLLKKCIAKTDKKPNRLNTKLKKLNTRIFQAPEIKQLETFSHPILTLLTNESTNNNEKEEKEETTEPNNTASSLTTALTKISETIPNSPEEHKGLSEVKARLSCNKNKKMFILDIFEDGFEASFFKKIAILYMIKKASAELDQFYTPSMIKKHCFKTNGIIYSKNRWHTALEVKDTLGFTANNFDILANAPVMDKHSPVAIAIATHIHHNIANHQGVDRSRFLAFKYVFIFNATRLFTEIIQDCIVCRGKNKTTYKQIMGPLSDNQLTYGAVGRYLMIDCSGPYEIKIAKRKTTRAFNNKQKCWILHCVCLVSHYSMAIILEDCTAETFVEAIHNLSCFLGYPQLILMDSSQAFIKGLKDIEFSFHDASNKLYLEKGITFKLCGTGGTSHAKHGLIEKRIDLFKRYFERCGKRIESLTIREFQTLVNQAATYLNSMPLAFKNRSDGSISSKYITPRSFLLGTLSNQRAPANLPNLPEEYSVIIRDRDEWIKSMRKFFFERIPDLLLRTKWEKDEKEDIKIDDIVLFKFNENSLKTDWKLGKVIDLETSKDNLPRIAHVSYISENGKEGTVKRATRKAVNTLVKIYSIHDKGINWNLKQVNDTVKEMINTPNLNGNNQISSMDDDPVSRDIKSGHRGLQLNYLIEKGENKRKAN